MGIRQNVLLATSVVVATTLVTVVVVRKFLATDESPDGGVPRSIASSRSSATSAPNPAHVAVPNVVVSQHPPLAAPLPTPPSASSDIAAANTVDRALPGVLTKQEPPPVVRSVPIGPSSSSILPVKGDIGLNTLAVLEARSELVIERLCNWMMNGTPPLIAMTGDRWWRKEKDGTEAIIASFTAGDRVQVDGAVLTLLATELQFDVENQRAFRETIKDSVEDMPDFVRESGSNEVGGATISMFARAMSGKLQEEEFKGRIAAMYDRTAIHLRSRYPDMGDRLATLLTRHRDADYMKSRYVTWAREKYPRSIAAAAEDLGVIEESRIIPVAFPGVHLRQFFVMRLKAPSLVTISSEKRQGSFSGYMLPRDFDGTADSAYEMISNGGPTDVVLMASRQSGEFLLRLDAGRTDREPRDVIVRVSALTDFGKAIPQIRGGRRLEGDMEVARPSQRDASRVEDRVSRWRLVEGCT